MEYCKLGTSALRVSVIGILEIGVRIALPPAVAAGDVVEMDIVTGQIV